MKKTSDLSITIFSDMRMSDLVEQLSSRLTHDQAFEFIMQLEKAFVDWEFTERLSQYFEAEIKSLRGNEE